MNSFLPNMRWLCLPSESNGQDWFEKSQKIDSLLAEEGMDLAEESVYLLFSAAPSDVLDGMGHCLIARPVIGPKKMVEAPLSLVDWVAAPVWRKTIQGETLNDILAGSEGVRLKVPKDSYDVSKGFFLSVQRRLSPELELTVDVIFYQ